MSISPVSSYYIRQLISQKRNFLKFVVAPKAAMEAHSLADINAVIDSLYPDLDEAWSVTQKLENLISMHQILKQNGEIYLENLTLIEKEIYWLLGFKYVEQEIYS